MTSVCIAGITGWMGCAVAAAVDAADDLELVSGVSRTAAGEGRVYGTVADALAATPADVLVDYTSAEAVGANVHAHWMPASRSSSAPVASPLPTTRTSTRTPAAQAPA